MNTNDNSNPCDATPAIPVEQDVEYLRSMAWDISERKSSESFSPADNHVALAMVNPCRGFAHWRISHQWIEETRHKHADKWNNSRMILRLYDVSYITFNGLNANHIQDQPLPCICGQMFFNLHHAGTWQLGEVGFLLRDGEFLPAARSIAVSFPRASTSSHGTQDALLVDERMRKETIGNLWEQDRILKERRTPQLRKPLRIALLCVTLEDSRPPEFIVKLATGLGESGHEVHVLTPASGDACPSIQGVHFHSVRSRIDGTPQEMADAFRLAAEQQLHEIPPCDIVHVHEWLSGTGLIDSETANEPHSAGNTADSAEFAGFPPAERLIGNLEVNKGGDFAKVCSLSSIESTRRNGVEPNAMSSEIEEAERQVAGAADVVLVPGWLRDKAVHELRIDAAHVHGFAMEGRLPNEWEASIDFGQVKRDIHVGPMDRLVLFIGPLEYASGPDLLLDALPVALQRVPNLRVAFAGAGEMYNALHHRARQLGVDHAIRLLGHVERNHVNRLLRASEALVLPSRYRVPFDDAVVDLARLAGRPVVTTHGGPAHLIRHEETGIITYDNPGSMVWALDRILGDPANARRMGENGRRNEGNAVCWNEVAQRYLELCGTSFPQLSEVRT